MLGAITPRMAPSWDCGWFSRLAVYLLHRGLIALGHRVTAEALTRPGAQVRNLARCRALWAAGEASYFMGRYAEAKDYGETSLSIAQEIGDKGREAEALRLLGYVVLAGGNRAMARAHFQDALALSRQLGDKRQLSRALNGLGASFYGEKRELEKAQPLFEEALALDRERGDRAGIAINLSDLGWTSIGLGLGDRAREMVREGFAIAEEIGSKRAGVAHLAVRRSSRHFSVSGSAPRDSMEQPRRYGRKWVITASQRRRSGAFIERAREALGCHAFAAAESAGRSLSYDEAIAEARAWLEQHS